MHACQNVSKNTFLLNILIYMLLKRVSAHLIISVNIITVSLTIQEYFPFFKEYEPTCN